MQGDSLAVARVFRGGSAVGSNFSVLHGAITSVAGRELPYRHTRLAPAPPRLVVVRRVDSAVRASHNPGVICRETRESEATMDRVGKSSIDIRAWLGVTASKYSGGPFIVRVCAINSRKYRHCSGNRHYSAYCQYWLFPSVPSDFSLVL